MSTATANPMFNQYSKSRSIPSFTAMTGNSKKSSNNNNIHWSNAAHTPDMPSWPDADTTPLEGGSTISSHQHSARLHSSNRISSSNPWSRGDHHYHNDTNWNNSQDELESSDQTRSDKICSEFEELEISDEGGPSLGNEGHHRLRNSDSDAMKDGVPSSSQVVEDSLDSGLWRGGQVSRNSMGSTSSVNSAGSSSSWKGSTGGGGVNNGGRSSSTGSYQRSASPRKHSGKYDNNRTMSTPGASTSKPGVKHPMKPKKHVMDIDEALDSLQGEPSGWGNLPSPKPSEVDTGTEVWGIPDDIKQKMKKEAVTRNGWSGTTNHSDDWSSNNSSSRVTTPSGWGGDMGKSLGNGRSTQWGNTPTEPSWTSSSATTPTSAYISKSNEKGKGFSDNVKDLVDMGFSVADSENALKRNNNHFESALGDLLALASVKEEEVVPIDLSPSNFPLPGGGGVSRGLVAPSAGTTNARLSPSSVGGGISPRTTSPSFGHFTKDHSLHVSASTPATPTLSATSTHNHLIQPVGSVAPPQLQRSNSVPQGDMTNINTPYVQKVLNQQLKDHHALKQQLINQLKTPQSPKHQQMLTLQLNKINANILLVDQQLSITNQLAMQQQRQRAGTTIDGLRESPLPSSANTLSPPEVFTMDTSTPSSINTDITMLHQQSITTSTTEHIDGSITRSMAESKLQRIISSGGSQELMTPDVFQGTNDMSDIGDSTTVLTTSATVNPIDPSYTNNGQPDDGSTLSTSRTTQLSPPQSSLTGSGKFTRSVDEIPEFKPGVPWNPGSSGGGGVANNNSSQRKYVSQRSDTNRRPDSIPLSSVNPYSMMDTTKNDSDYYQPDGGIQGYNNPHLSTNQYQRRAGTTPAGQSTTPRGYSNTGSGGYPVSGGFGGNGSGYYGRGQSVGGQVGYQAPRPSPSTPSYQSTPQYNSSIGSSRNQRQRLYSQQATTTSTGGYGEGGMSGPSQQRRGGFDPGRKWSFDGSNPWGVPEKSGSSIWSVDSSNETSSILSESEPAVFSPAIEWRAPIRKPSLPVNLSAPPTNCILLKNVSPQVDELSIREVCSEFGFVQSCTLNTMIGAALVFYQSKEEVIQAKLGLEKNPMICGVNVQPLFATEKTISTFNTQRTPGHAPYHLSANVSDPTPWLSSSEISPSATQQLPSRMGSSNRFVSTIPRHNDHLKSKTAWGGDQFTAAPGGPTLGGSTPSSSVWNSGGILPGISNSWSSNPQSTTTNPTSVPVVTNSTDTTNTADADSVTGTSPLMATYLPNGLF